MTLDFSKTIQDAGKSTLLKISVAFTDSENEEIYKIGRNIFKILPKKTLKKSAEIFTCWELNTPTPFVKRRVTPNTQATLPSELLTYFSGHLKVL